MQIWIAYDIVLRIIMDADKEHILEDYTYLAPMMYMDFFDLYILYRPELA